MTKYVWRNDTWVEYDPYAPRPAPVFPMIMRDTKAYISPITGKEIDGRVARREDLKKHGCREIDPSEFKPVYRNKAFAKKHGLELGGDPLPRTERVEQ